MDILKNPILIGVTAGAITYGYLTMTVNEKNEKNKKKGKKVEKETVNLLIPFVVGVIAWFVSYAYFEYSCETKSNNTAQEIGMSQIPVLPIPLPPSPKYNFIKDIISESSDPQQFSLVNPGVTVPNKLPDVLMEMY